MGIFDFLIEGQVTPAEFGRRGKGGLYYKQVTRTGFGASADVVVTNVPMDVVDLSASNFPVRFYRTLSQ